MTDNTLNQHYMEADPRYLKVLIIYTENMICVKM